MAIQKKNEPTKFYMIITFKPYDPVVFDMRFQRTSSSAIEGGCRPHNFYIAQVFLPQF